ncbi:hypothetical protein FXF51_57975 [Nonomuraea sp. PA05]|uniref:hypothetical protein n=1 Tax=Nonomuraea sp. PA05 TaxID=2604466 RepID=UPI0011D7F293|nr:hypothetical protein [Nonomuraea sp. PA05]TYB47528.1 hypothetical protein FXF51_57975 [Nonomuraea sp. PA05]
MERPWRCSLGGGAPVAGAGFAALEVVIVAGPVVWCGAMRGGLPRGGASCRCEAPVSGVGAGSVRDAGY